MTPEEARRRLREAGIPEGWSPSTDGLVEGLLLGRQRALLTSLEGLVEKQIEQDQKQVSELHSALQKLKAGGGKAAKNG